MTAWLFRQAECDCELRSSSKPRDAGNSPKQPARVPVLPPEQSSLVGQVIACRYEVQMLVGVGGMGCVYKVLDRTINAIVAIKVISDRSTDRATLERRLEQEAMAAQSLNDPRIVAIREFGKIDDGSPFLVMDYIDGESLEWILHNESYMSHMPIERAINIFIQLAQALVHAHSKTVVHRDLKPSNVLLTRTENGEENVKVIDFGIAKISNSAALDKTKLTQSGDLVGSPLYMSPEQCRGDELDGRSDIYSLGCIMYEALSGRCVFDGENPVRILLKHISEQPVRFTKELRIPSDMERIILRCLSKLPSDRYQNAAAVLRDLEKIRDGRRIGAHKIEWTRHRIGRWTSIVGGSLALLGLVAFTANYLDFEDLTPDRPASIEGQSLADLDKEIETHPQSATAYYQRAQFQKLRNERANAIEDYGRAITLDPKFGEALLARSTMLAVSEDYERSLADTNKCIQLFPLWANPYGRRAADEFSMQHYEQSIKDAEKNLSIQWEGLGFATLAKDYSALGQYKLALAAAFKDLDTVMKIHPKSSSVDAELLACQIIAQTYLDAHDSDNARVYIRRALALRRKSAKPWSQLAIIYARQNNMAEALKANKRAAAFELYPAEAFSATGDMYAAAGQWRTAAENYNTSISLQPLSTAYLRKRAICESNNGELNGAEGDLNKTLSLSPMAPLSNSALAVVEEQLHKPAEADKYLAEAFATAPDLPLNILARAKIALSRGHLQSTIEDCNQAIELDNFLKEAYGTRAIALARMGLTQEASTDYAIAENKLGWHRTAFDISQAALPVMAPDKNAQQPKLIRPPLGALQPAPQLAWAAPHLSDWQAWTVTCGLFCSPLNEPDFAFNHIQPWNGTPQGVKHALTLLSEKPFNVKDRDSFLARCQSLDTSPVSDLSQRAINEVQAIWLCQLGYECGFISEPEFWDYALPHARTLQATFKSWEELAGTYKIAINNSPSADVKEKSRAEKTVDGILKNLSSPARRLSFNMVLIGK